MRLRIVIFAMVIVVCLTAIACILFFRLHLAPITDNEIHGTILDLSNQPIAGVPLMLYAGTSDKGDCLYSCISNTFGKFSFPRPSMDDTYCLATILDKERFLISPIIVSKEAHFADLQIIYYGAQAPIKKPVEIVTSKPNPTPTPPKINPSTKTTYGSLSGKIYDENRNPCADGSMDLVAENLETQAIQTLHVNIKRGEYEVIGLLPGIYQIKANLSGYPEVKGLEVFVLSNQIAQLDIQFKKVTPTSTKKGAEISVAVIDATWTPQINAQITLISRATGNIQDGQTDENGELVFHNVAPGDYEVIAVFNGLRGRCELREDLIATSGKFISLVLREME